MRESDWACFPENKVVRSRAQNVHNLLKQDVGYIVSLSGSPQTIQPHLLGHGQMV